MATGNSSVRVIKRNPAYALNGDSDDNEVWMCQGVTTIVCTLSGDAVCNVCVGNLSIFGARKIFMEESGIQIAP